MLPNIYSLIIIGERILNMRSTLLINVSVYNVLLGAMLYSRSFIWSTESLCLLIRNSPHPPPLKTWQSTIPQAKCCVCVCVYAQLHLTLCNPMNCSLPGSSIHGISRQKYWSGLPFPTPGDLSDPGFKTKSSASPTLAGRFFNTEPPEKPSVFYTLSYLTIIL